jgi:periplasmic serine protease, Do/DeqQ family
MSKLFTPSRTLRSLAALMLAVALGLTGPASGFTDAAHAEEKGALDQLGDLFRETLRGSRDTAPAPQAGAPVPNGQDTAQTRVVPRSRGEMMQSFSPLVKATAPAVVNVYADRTVVRRSPFSGDPFFEQFFGQAFPGRTEKQSSLGSGVLVERSGIIVTNNHVIDGADDIRVALSDGREFPSTVLLKDERFDVAILKIEGKGDFPTIEFGDSDALEVGDLVLAIGNPFGVGQTVTSGIVSALARNRIGVSDFGFFIQTDAAINPGNSGGALIDMNGRLIGINTAIFSRSGGSNGIGFAIPANLIRAVALSAESGSDRFEPPYIGATFETVTPDIAEALALPNASGALVTSVVRDGPAATAGLRAGDIVVAFNGQQVEHPDALGYRLATVAIGSRAVLGVIGRDGRRDVEVTVAKAPPEIEEKPVLIEGRNPFAGASVSKLTPRLARKAGLPEDAEGVVITELSRRSPAAQYGFRPGDVITELNGAKIASAADMQEAVRQEPFVWRFEIIRNGQRIRQMVR